MPVALQGFLKPCLFCSLRSEGCFLALHQQGLKNFFLDFCSAICQSLCPGCCAIDLRTCFLQLCDFLNSKGPCISALNSLACSLMNLFHKANYLSSFLFYAQVEEALSQHFLLSLKLTHHLQQFSCTLEQKSLTFRNVFRNQFYLPLRKLLFSVIRVNFLAEL